MRSAGRELAIEEEALRREWMGIIYDLVVGTHGRGIWIIDDITPLRALSTGLMTKEAAFIGARPVQQRISGPGGWANGCI